MSNESQRIGRSMLAGYRSSPNLISTNIARPLSLSVSSTKKKITRADGTCRGAVMNIPVTFDKLKTEMDFIVVDEVSIGVSIEVLKMNELRPCKDLRVSTLMLPSEGSPCG